jgi:hypothetical protein
LLRGQLGKPLEEQGLRLGGRQRGQARRFQRGGRGTEDLFGLLGLEPGELGRFEIGREDVGLFEQRCQSGRRLGRQTEADVDGRLKSQL